jgi:hypothetical protein
MATRSKKATPKAAPKKGVRKVTKKGNRSMAKPLYPRDSTGAVI